MLLLERDLGNLGYLIGTTKGRIKRKTTKDELILKDEDEGRINSLKTRTNDELIRTDEDESDNLKDSGRINIEGRGLIRSFVVPG